MSDNKILGIDLGTTNSCMAVFDQGIVTVIPNAEGQRTTPSIVHIADNGEVIVGHAAKPYTISNPNTTIRSIKRLMGKYYSELGTIASSSPYQIVPSDKGRAAIRITISGESKDYLPEQISAFILQKMKKDAEAYLGTSIQHAVITVPAYFNDAQRQAVRDAGTIAGLQVARILNEPTAAAIAYGINKRVNESLMIFDLGGGTHDVSILKTGDNIFDVISTSGDTDLGGDDWDKVVQNHFLEQIQSKHHVSVTDHSSLQRLRDEAEMAKIQLSSAPRYMVNLPFLVGSNGQALHFTCTLTKETMERLTEKLVLRTLVPVIQAMADAKLEAKSIDRVIPVGGMTRSPAVIAALEKHIGKPVTRGVNPDEAVAMGAAFQGASIKGELKTIELSDITPLSLGVETWGGLMKVLIPRNTKIPVEQKDYFTNAIDDQPAFDIHVLQGERPMAQENKSLGIFRINELPKLPRGRMQLELSFQVDVDGILMVKANEVSSGNAQELTICDSYALTSEEIKYMQESAVKQQESDDVRVKQAHQFQLMSDIIYECDTLIKKHSDQFTPDELMQIQNIISTAAEEKKNSDISTYTKRFDDIRKLFAPIAKKATALLKKS